jgi:hypothetical protein
MGIGATPPREVGARSRLPVWAVLPLLLLLAAVALPAHSVPSLMQGSPGTGPQAGPASPYPSGAKLGDALSAGRSSGPLPSPGRTLVPAPMTTSLLQQVLWTMGLGGMAALGFSLRFRKRKDGGAPPSGLSAPGTGTSTNPSSPGQGPGATGKAASEPHAKSLGGPEGVSETAAAPPLPDMAPPSSTSSHGPGPVPGVVPGDQAICPLCGAALSGPNAPCPNCTPSLVPAPASSEEGAPTPSTPQVPPEALSTIVSGAGRRGTSLTLPATPATAEARCMVCGGPLKEGYCPVCRMRWSD